MRTFQVAAMLRGAARTKCRVCDSDDGRRALAAVEEVYRTSTGIYESFSELLADRARNRGLWVERERDPSFKRVDDASKPLEFPAEYNVRNGKIKSEGHFLGVSPFPDGSNDFLEHIAEMVRQWGEAFANATADSLPSEDPVKVAGGKLIDLNFDLVPLVQSKKKKGKKRKASLT
ncbi:hypothetical protein MPSEU_001029000 [Mayamaea pseudoterrestris]|nr:hypothetical protein MPSEU_001029000 [Mayamaea pseudoterrestris]